MKVLNHVTVAAFLLTVSMGFANGPAKSEVERKLINVEMDPVFVKKGDKLFINMLNLDQETIIVKVYDSEGRVVYKEAIKGEVVVEKAFNFEKAFEDKYTVVVADETGTYRETVLVK
ncbi:hypothetical protein [Flagellimonas nanhaiensis]|uniref:DUF3244 domain-containing protein n=1 Tax=Flagellimonas nanhaiensis TaxID=2292706 RepID=A0A371JL91_9FLAO|nr:hypothetical protein [Allomuricauda nanhaiensis]RDY57671.1 hypothetical protein DX873_18305 [Allomuricauda nanhaiensis]